MSRINDLIKKLCPNGVEYKRIDEISESIRGMNSVSNKWAEDGNCKFIDYMNAYKNLAIDVTKKPYATVKDTSKQTSLKKGDILFTSASETIDECALSSVTEDEIEDNIFMDDHLFGIRLLEKYESKYSIKFLKHYFRSKEFRLKVDTTVRGVTRFYVSKPDFMKQTIPMPPLEVQNEIAIILDKFGELEAELEAELETRKSQYEFWRGKLLSSVGTTYKLEDICDISAGGTPSKSKSEYWENGTIKWLGSSVCENKKTVREVTSYITELGLSKSSAKLLKTGSTLIAMVGATIGKVAYLDFEACTNQNVACLYPKDTTVISNDYLYYLCTTLYKKFTDLANGSFAIASLGFIRNLEVVVPNLERQKYIVDVLDKFEELTNDMVNGLPAEIEARRKQYEYYRNKLLSFEEVEVNE